MPTQRIAVRIPRNQTDPDAQAFITAAGITDTTQQSAINTLVTNLKTYGIWTKMKALYPMVGGTSTAHKFNLKDPRDLDVAFRLQFNGGWTHSANGALPNGTNGYANTYLIENTSLNTNDSHISIYSRTNTSAGVQCEIGAATETTQSNIFPNFSGIFYPRVQASNSGTGVSLDTRGLFMANRVNSTQVQGWRNTTKYTISSVSTGKVTVPFWLANLNNNGVSGNVPSQKQLAFASIGDGLTDVEATNFYTAVQSFQATLGRQIGVPIVSDSDAQAFLNAADITDVTQANAVNNLVIGMKADSIWTKMKALYPMVGGTAASHKFNLKDPRDLDAAFRLQFNGGWTHSVNGALPNGTNAYANTNFTPSVNGTGLNNLHIGYYSRTNNTSLGGEIGIYGPPFTLIFTRYNNIAYFGVNGTYPEISNTNSSGLFVASRTTSNEVNLFRNNTKLLAASSTSTSSPTYPLFLGAISNSIGTAAQNPSDRQCAFSSIGDGLTDAEAANFYTRVQAFQTTLGRQV